MARYKHMLSREIFMCLTGGGRVECGAEVFTVFKGSIEIGNNVKIGKGAIISNYERPGSVKIGDGTIIGWNNNYYCQGGLVIGRNVLFASNVCILTANHGFANLGMPIVEQESEYDAVVIGDDSWIGYNVIILPGVSIGRHVVIGAGSVVTHDMPDNSVCAGNPCKVIRIIKGRE